MNNGYDLMSQRLSTIMYDYDRKPQRLYEITYKNERKWYKHKRKLQ